MTARPSIIRPCESDEYYFKEGCHILEVLNSAEDTALSIARARVTSGVTTTLHALRDTTERYYILSGHGEVSVGDMTATVAVGDVVVIPAGVPQKIRNTATEDLIFLAICTPRFKVENYREV